MAAKEGEGSSQRQMISTASHQPDQMVIVIESDAEEDNRTLQETQPIRLIPDRRLDRPRDSMNRFLNADGTNVAAQRVSQNELISEDHLRGEDDEIAIVGEVSRPVEYDGPIDPGAEFVDLDEEPEFSTEIAPSSTHPYTILINGENHEQPSNSNNNTAVELNSNGDEDDGLIIVQERTTAPRVTLNLPGGETLEINASPTDRPVRRSFEWQENMRQPRRQMLRRSARRVGQLLFHPDGNEGDDSTPVRLPANVTRFRQQEQHRLRQSEMRRRHQEQHNVDLGRNDPALTELRRRIDTFPPNVRSAFEHSASLHEFRSILETIAPITLQECDGELVPLFTEYRSRMVQSWAAGRVQSNQEEEQRIRDEIPERQRRLRERRRHLRVHMGVGGGFGESLANYILMNANGAFGNNETPAGWTYNDEYYGEYNEEERTQSIVNMIQEREEREHDFRTKNYMEKSKSQQEAFVKRSLQLPDGYSASFDTQPKIKLDIVKNGKQESVIVEDDSLSSKWEDVPACCLCGVELGVGIPDDFAGIDKQDRSVSFECLVFKYQFHCPYQSLARPSQLDRDLSKRTFVASCGHSFCGRCFARIDNARSKSRIAKKKLAHFKGSSHPDNYGPKTCPAEGCKTSLRSKGKMREAFF